MTREKTEEWDWVQPDMTQLPTKIKALPGVKVKECEMVAAHWALRSKIIPEHDEVLIAVKPEWTEIVPTVKPGFWKESRVQVDGHYETQEIWIPEHTAHELKEIPGYYKIEKVLVPAHKVDRVRTVAGHYDTKEVWRDSYYVTRYYWQPPHPARGLPGMWKSYQELVSGGYVTEKVWVKMTTEVYQELILESYKETRVWIDTTWIQVDVVVPGQFRDHRVWVETTVVRKDVWFPEETTFVKVVHEKEVIKTILAVPAKTVQEDYWQAEAEVCQIVTKNVYEAGGIKFGDNEVKVIGDWFSWFQGTPIGQLWVQTAFKEGWLEKYSAQEIAREAFNSFRTNKPDISVEVMEGVVLKFRPDEFEKMLSSAKGREYLRSKGMFEMANKIQRQIIARGKTEWTPDELSLLVGVAKVAAVLAVLAGVAYWAWPVAKYDYGITYTDWVYVLRYKEEFNYADLVAISMKGQPTYLITDQKGGPIMGETRGPDVDVWNFGEKWMWSSYVEEGRWLGIGETRYWYEAEVEYLGMVSKTGALYYTQHGKTTRSSTGGHEPGWMKPIAEWGKWKTEEDRNRL